MSLPVLAALVVVGIALIVLAIHLSGGSRAAAIESEDHARALFAADHPNRQAQTVVLTANRRSAFLQLDGGRFGLVHAIGARFLTRVYASQDIATVGRDGDRALLLRPDDFTFSGGRFEFASRQAADSVAHLLTCADETGKRAA